MNFFALPSSLAALVASLALAAAQYPPPASYQEILTSPLNPQITVAYKQPPAGTCTTAFSTQMQYTGYIGLPPFTLAPIQQNYSINTFFWFIEARQLPEAAPLTIWLSGGPGTSSMVGLFNEMGPCQVVQVNDGSYGTEARPFGWDRSSNLLFIDQPNQVGFSYDTATNASYDLLTGDVFEPPTPPRTVLPSYMYMNGTFGTANTNGQFDASANTTEIAAEATWHFLQTWLAAFPQYNPATRPNMSAEYARYWSTVNPAGVNLWTESYGGKYGPVFARLFERQNQRRDNGTLPSNSTLPITLTSVGIVNGLIDDLIQDSFYPNFAYNNTYGIQAISQIQELNAMSTFGGSGGCLSAIQTCRYALEATDPEGYGHASDTNSICEYAQITCANVSSAYYGNGYNPYDIRQKLPSPDMPAAYQEYLNNASVLAAIGARVNYTESSPYVQSGFISTGDTIRGGQIEDLAYLLTQGIRVALIYGDADYICNWMGGQAVSYAIANRLPNYPPPSPSSTSPGLPVSSASASASTPSVYPGSYAANFPAAGYASIVVNASYVGGVVRQFGNLSFSRIYDAGHFVPYFQAETAFTVFTRVIEGNDISLGTPINSSSFRSSGPQNATHTNSVPPAPSKTCWIRAFNQTCSQDDLKAMLAGSGTVMNGIFYQNSASMTLPTSVSSAGVPGHPIVTANASMQTGSPAFSGGSTMGLTGVYTATGTPSPTSRAAAVGSPVDKFERRVWPLLGLGVGLAVGVAVVL